MGEAKFRRENGLMPEPAIEHDDDMVDMRGNLVEVGRPDPHAPRSVVGEVVAIHRDDPEPFLYIRLEQGEITRKLKLSLERWRGMSRNPGLPLGYLAPELGMKVVVMGLDRGPFKSWKVVAA